MTRPMGLVLFFLTLIFYLVTLQPALAWGDGIRLQREVITAESFILAEMVDVTFAPDPLPFARLGVAAWDHPLYVIIGHLLVQSLPGVDSLWLVNLISALFAAGAIALFFRWCHRHTGSLPAATFAALALALSHTFWWHAVTPEVYTLFAFLLLLTITFYEQYEETGRRPYLYAAAFTLGLGAANHLLALLILPAYALRHLIVKALHRPQSPISNLQSPISDLPTTRPLLTSTLFFLLGFSPTLIQFLRLLRTFPLSQVMGPAVGATFLQGSLALSPALLAQSVLSYLTFLAYQFGPPGLLLGLYGWWKGRRVAPRLWSSALALYLVTLAFGLVYRVSDQFAFFLGAHLFWAVAMALGSAVLYRRLPGNARARRWVSLGLALWLVAMPFIYGAAPDLLRSTGVSEAEFGIPQIGTGVRDGLNYYLNPNKRGDRQAQQFGRETLRQLPPDAVVLAQWYVDTDEYFVFRYFMAVKGMRPDVDVEGWPTVDPFAFDAQLALQKVDASLPERPVYLASLSDDFYAASQLVDRYCVAPQFNLYRVYAGREEADGACLTATALEE